MEITSLLEPRLSSATQTRWPAPVCLKVLRTQVFGMWHTSLRNWGLMWCQWVKRTLQKLPWCSNPGCLQGTIAWIQKLPGVSSCIDGTHIPIKCPSTPAAEDFRNHKNCFSVNVHGACTSELQLSKSKCCCTSERCNSWFPDFPELLSVFSGWKRWSSRSSGWGQWVCLENFFFF